MRKILAFLFMTTHFLQATAPFTTIADEAQLPIKTPCLKNREFSKIQLANGLSVYLVSDPEAEKSACALGVKVGSWQDPKEFPGLAHLLEHMLFLGNEKYPESNSFSSFLTDHNGSNNAFTAAQKTVYMFSIDNSYFSEALDRFSQFFLSPLLEQSQIAAELVNVDQEHEKNIVNDQYREYMVFKELCNPQHPHATFATGNAQTLGNIPAEALRKWFDKHYNANQMYLVVYATNPIAVLQELVVEKFSAIKNCEKKTNSFLPPLFTPKESCCINYIEPIKDLQKLKVYWPLPEQFINDKNKSLELLAFTLGRGQKASLEEVLKNQELIHELQIGSVNLGNTNPFFCVDFSLTDKGLQQKETIITYLFSALEAVKSSSIPLYLFREMNGMQELSYAYQARSNPFQFVQQTAGALIDSQNLAAFPRNCLLAEEFCPEKIEEALKYLTPKNALFICIASQQKTGFSYEKKERWMQASYTQKPISQEQLALWEKASIQKEIQLAPPNPYIPKNLRIVPKQEALQNPTKLIDEPSGKVFLMQGHEFSSPKVVHYLHVHTPKIKEDIRSCVLMDLYLEIMNKSLAPKLLGAQDAGLYAHLYHKKAALHLVVEGYCEKAPFLIEQCFDTILFTPVEESSFSLVKNSLSKDFSNGKHDLPIYQASDLLKSFLHQDLHTKQEKAAILENITYQDFLDFRESLFEQAYVEAFLSGNITQKDAELIWLDVANLLEANEYPKTKHPCFSPVTLPEQEGPFCLQKTTTSSGTGVILTIDQGSATDTKKASQLILSKALHEGFFHTLRTEQNTAYIAGSSSSEHKKHLYQHFFVQSSSHNAIDLLYRFELFLETFLQNFSKTLPESRFTNIRNSLLKSLEHPYRNLAQKTEYFDYMAFEQNENFLYKENRKKAMKNLDYATFVAFAFDWLSRNNTKRLAILYQGEMGKPFSYDTLSKKHLEKLLQVQLESKKSVTKEITEN